MPSGYKVPGGFMRLVTVSPGMKDPSRILLKIYLLLGWLYISPGSQTIDVDFKRLIKRRVLSYVALTSFSYTVVLNLWDEFLVAKHSRRRLRHT